MFVSVPSKKEQLSESELKWPDALFGKFRRSCRTRVERRECYQKQIIKQFAQGLAFLLVQGGDSCVEEEQDMNLNRTHDICF